MILSERVRIDWCGDSGQGEGSTLFPIVKSYMEKEIETKRGGGSGLYMC